MSVSGFIFQQDDGPRASTYLLNVDTVVLEEKEAVVSNGGLDLLDEGVDDRGVIRVEQRQVNGRQGCKTLGLLGDRRWNPIVDVRLARQVRGRRVEGGGFGHDDWTYILLW